MNWGIQQAIVGVMPKVIESGLCVSACTIQQPDGNYTGSGAPSGPFIAISARLTGIVCMDAPKQTSDKTFSAMETPTGEQIETSSWRHVFLTGLYPEIVAGWRSGWRAVITTPGGSSNVVAYDLRGVECDSQSTQTRLDLELARV